MKKNELINHIEKLRLHIVEHILNLEKIRDTEMLKENPDIKALNDTVGRIDAYEDCAKWLNNIIICYYR